MSTRPDLYPDLDNHVIVVDGYGITIRVERGHLTISDGAGRNRRDRRIPRIGHNLSRLIVIGHTGSITLDALRWLDKVGIHFTQLDTDGQLLTTSANPKLDDPRLRRAQHRTLDGPAGVEIARYLIDAKLAGQYTVARTHLGDDTAEVIDTHRQQLDLATSIEKILRIEAAAAKDYFAAWNTHTITWATKHRDRVPDHWHSLGTRRSLLTRTGNRRATNPVNALLNYLYALGEIECRNACLTLGLDPGLGYLHTDTPQRDSLALDLLETIRPDIDHYTLDLIEHHIFRADDLTEHDDGHCRITPPLTHRLAATLLDWQLAVAPHAEHIGDRIAAEATSPVSASRVLTRDANQHTSSDGRTRVGKHHGTACRDCGSLLAPTATLYCPDCLPARRSAQRRAGVAAAAAQLTDRVARAERGRLVSEGRNAATLAAASDYGLSLLDWERVAGRVGNLSLKEIMHATGLAVTQASKIKRGKTLPHPRHWRALIGAVNQATGRVPPQLTRCRSDHV